MALGTPGGITTASDDLGLGSMLSDQVAGETEEQRKKRLLALQQKQQQPGRPASPAAQMLFGMR